MELSSSSSARPAMRDREIVDDQQLSRFQYDCLFTLAKIQPVRREEAAFVLDRSELHTAEESRGFLHGEIRTGVDGLDQSGKDPFDRGGVRCIA
jgi:hypothetical protein